MSSDVGSVLDPKIILVQRNFDTDIVENKN